MQEKRDFSTISLKMETVDKLKTIKACFQIGRKKNINFDELINRLIDEGLEKVDPKVNRIYQSSIEEDEEESQQEEEIEDLPAGDESDIDDSDI